MPDYEDEGNNPLPLGLAVITDSEWSLMLLLAIRPSVPGAEGRVLQVQLNRFTRITPISD